MLHFVDIQMILSKMTILQSMFMRDLTIYQCLSDGIILFAAILVLYAPHPQSIRMNIKKISSHACYYSKETYRRPISYQPEP